MTDPAKALMELILADPWRRDILATVRDLALPDWAIGAGFVRGAVWDHLHGFAERSPLDDIDVIYFDSADPAEEREKELEAALLEAAPAEPWSVKNQARMHLRNGDRPYRSTEDALRHWLETPTAVAVRLEPDLPSPTRLASALAQRERPGSAKASPGESSGFAQAGDRLTLLAPHGLDDLWSMRVRPTPSGRRRQGEYDERMAKKDWPGRWPKVRVEQS